MQVQIGNDIIDVKMPKSLKGILVGGGIFLLILILAVTSFYTVQVEEEGVVLRFGKHVDTVGPGLHFKAPFGIDEVIRVPVTRQLKQEFGFGTEGNTNRYQWTNPNEMRMEKNMVTGDLNSALVEWVIQYRIADPKRYLFEVRNADETLRDASESVMREVVGDRTVDEVITIGRQEIAEECSRRLDELIKLYNLGLTIDQVQLKNVNPPEPVQASFNEVNTAQQDKEKAINVANGEYNRTVPKARGQALQKISEAEGYASARVNEAEGDVARFSALLAEYKKAPDVTRRRIYLETMEEALPAMGRRVILDGSGQDVLPVLPLDVLKGTTKSAAPPKQ